MKLLFVFLLSLLLAVQHVEAVCCGSGVCNDGTLGDFCCGVGSCNIFCCNCDDGCRGVKNFSSNGLTFEEFSNQLREKGVLNHKIVLHIFSEIDVNKDKVIDD